MKKKDQKNHDRNQENRERHPEEGFNGTQNDYRTTKDSILDYGSEYLMGVDKPFMPDLGIKRHELNPNLAKEQFNPQGKPLESAHDGGLHTEVTKDAHTK